MSSDDEQSLDFTSDAVADRPLQSYEPRPVPYDPARAREKMRGRIAVALLVLLGTTVVVGLSTAAACPDRIDALLKLFNIIFSPLVALVGTSIGFYFATKSDA